jgi:hypothetical protein
MPRQNPGEGKGRKTKENEASEEHIRRFRFLPIPYIFQEKYEGAGSVGKECECCIHVNYRYICTNIIRSLLAAPGSCSCSCSPLPPSPLPSLAQVDHYSETHCQTQRHVKKWVSECAQTGYAFGVDGGAGPASAAAACSLLVLCASQYYKMYQYYF